MSRQQSFEKYYAEQHDVPAETMVQYRWAEQDGYRLPGISAAYRNYCAGWDAGQPQMKLGNFIAEVFYLQGDEPFICSVIGRVCAEQLALAQKDFNENQPDVLDRGTGVYKFDFFYESGQYDGYGRCEIAPGWGFDFISFEKLEEEVAA